MLKLVRGGNLIEGQTRRLQESLQLGLMVKSFKGTVLGLIVILLLPTQTRAGVTAGDLI